jgi:pimeloyl-ACP methyl ester carboxylesterase
MRPPSIPAIPPLWRESRVPLELASLVRDPIYKGIGVEDAGGQPVLLIPGFLAGDDTLGLMTQWLRRTGHRTRKAGIRTNIDCSEVSVRRLEERIEVMAETHRQKVAIVGQSRGGTLAKVLGVRRPDLVSGVAALGAPIVDPLGVHPLVRMQVYAVGTLGTLGLRGFFKHSCRVGSCCERFWEDLEKPMPRGVGFLSIYSKSDGIVKWRACLDRSAVNHEISGSHVGMAVHPDAYRAVAGALAAFRGGAGRGARSMRARRTVRRAA